MAVLHDRLLQGIRILDAGQVIAGPFVGSLLADMGAEVIKVELPARSGEGGNAGNILRASETRNKKSITLDLRNAEGQELARKLVAVSDAIVENYSPGTMERWGLGFEDLVRVNPRIVMVRVSGYGQTGPYRDRTSYDRIGQAFGGLLYVTGEADQPPAHPGYMLGDYITGTFGALAVLGALYHRDQLDCDEPQVVDLSLYESIFRYSGQLAPEFSKSGLVRERSGTVRDWSLPGDQFKTLDGKWILIIAPSQQTWERLAHAMEMPDLIEDLRFVTQPERREHINELHGIIRDWVGARDSGVVQQCLAAQRVPFGPVYSIADIVTDPQYQERGDLVVVDDPLIGPTLEPAAYPRFSHSPGRVYAPAPLVGAHNDEVYGGLLGLTSDDLQRLRDAGAI